MTNFKNFFLGKSILILLFTVSVCLGLTACEEEKIYVFHVQNTSNLEFYIDCWSEITVSGMVSPFSSGTIILENARSVEYIELCTSAFHIGYYVANYATFDVVVDSVGFAILYE